MSESATSRHQEWLEALDPRVRAEVEAEIAYYKPDGLWEFEELEPEDDWQPSSRVGLTVHFSSDEMRTLRSAFDASSEVFEIMHDTLMARARAVLAERGESDTDTVAAAD